MTTIMKSTPRATLMTTTMKSTTEADAHDHDHDHDHAHGAHDPHAWLSPETRRSGWM
jgi:ABC-type Zn2+ transport system substrate-binding protein/surface adhesin